LSALVAIPLSRLGARAMVTFVNGLLNFDARLDRFPPEIIGLQVGVAVLVPLVAALIPVLSSARRSPALALSEYGRDRVWSGVRVVDRALQLVRGLTRPERMAFRNPFRNRSRLILSLIMLSLAGGSFIMVTNLQSSLRQTVDTMLNLWQYDFWVAFAKPTWVERLESEPLQVPGVLEAEGWGFEMTRRVRPDGSESNPIFLFAAPPESAMVRPTIVQGRWLKPDDERALVVGIGLLEVEPDLEVGKELVLKVNGEEQRFHIVGVIEIIGNRTVGYITYTSRDTYNRMVHQKDRADMAVVRTSATTPDQRRSLASAVETAYEDAGIQVASVLQIDDERLEINSAFDILIVLLMVMVLLLSLVGGLGLMGTMSLNVLERSREIGVMRAFGGSNRSVFRVVVLEGVAVGVMSWLLSLLLAIPLTRLFCDVIGHSFLDMALGYRYSAGGAFTWLGLVILLSAISSALPAANAVRLTVREVLAYE
jgi:putative ABC transport system permease protein